MAGGGVTLRALISLNTRTPACTNKIIHLRTTTKDAPRSWLTNLFCPNSKVGASFKQRHLTRGDTVSGAELIPDLSVIVHGWIVKRWLVWVKEIVGGKSDLKVFLGIGLVDWI